MRVSFRKFRTRVTAMLIIPKRCIPDFELYGPEFTRLNNLKPVKYRYQGRIIEA